MKELMQMLSKKKAGKMDKNEKESKMEVLKHLHQLASEMMGDGMLEGMKKVTVAGKDAESLEMGLDKAKALINKMEEDPTEELESEEEEDEN